MEGSPDELFRLPPLYMQQLSNPLQGCPLSNQGSYLVGDPIIPMPLAQIGFDALCHKTTEHPCELSFFPMGKRKGEVLLLALVVMI
jgi:hypothetical protein